MSFSGKKFKRTRCENVEEFCNVAQAPEHLNQLLQAASPTFSFTRNEDQTFTFSLDTGGRVMTNTIELGRQVEMVRRDGSKVNVIYTLEDENTLSQVIFMPDGKVAHFKRHFGETETKMIISLDGSDVTATIYYELVQ